MTVWATTGLDRDQAPEEEDVLYTFADVLTWSPLKHCRASSPMSAFVVRYDIVGVDEVVSQPCKRLTIHQLVFDEVTIPI